MIRFGVVGTGNMGRNHARILADLPGVTLAGVYDQDCARAETVAAATGSRAWADLDGLLAAVDAVVVAVPTAAHYAVGRRCLEAGRHTLMEKPLAANTTEAEALCRLAAANGPALMVGYVERFNPAVCRLRTLLERDTPLFFSFTRVGPEPAPGGGTGVILDLAIHDLDLMLHLSGQPVRHVAALAAGAGREDTASLSFLLDDGCLAHLTVNWLTPFKVREIQVATAQRLYRCNLLRQQLTAFSRQPGGTDSYAVTEIPVRYEEPLRAELAAFARAIATGEAPPVPCSAALPSLRLAETCLAQVYLARTYQSGEV